MSDKGVISIPSILLHGLLRRFCKFSLVAVFALLVCRSSRLRPKRMLTKAPPRLIILLSAIGLILILPLFWTHLRIPIPALISSIKSYHWPAASPSTEVPSSPSFLSPPPPSERKWLVAVMCPASPASKRKIIRDTWHNLYSNQLFKLRFVLSSFNDSLDASIAQENKTYGDIVKLEWLSPSREVSVRPKPMEFLRHLVRDGKRYQWVSKLDKDAFLAANEFYARFLNTTYADKNTLISLKLRQELDYYWPGGAFYTLSWGLMEELARIHANQTDSDTPEDVRVGNIYSTPRWNTISFPSGGQNFWKYLFQVHEFRTKSMRRRYWCTF